jgi:hypothetical protein
VQGVLAHAARTKGQRGSGGAWSDRYRWEHSSGLFALARLTLDLDAGGNLKQTAPSLHRLLRRTIGTQPRKLDTVRRGWLKQLGGVKLLADVLRFWHEHVASFVPDPNLGGYDLCVEWLAATRELDRESGDRILTEWASAHRLKRNLWGSVRHGGIPVPEGVKEGSSRGK